MIMIIWLTLKILQAFNVLNALTAARGTYPLSLS